MDFTLLQDNAISNVEIDYHDDARLFMSKVAKILSGPCIALYKSHNDPIKELDIVRSLYETRICDVMVRVDTGEYNTRDDRMGIFEYAVFPEGCVANSRFLKPGLWRNVGEMQRLSDELKERKYLESRR